MLRKAKEEINLKIVELEKKLSEAKTFLGLEKTKRRLLEDNKKLSNKVLMLEKKLKTLEEKNDEINSDDSLI